MLVEVQTDQLKPILDDFNDWITREDTLVQGAYVDAISSVKNILLALRQGQLVLASHQQQNPNEQPIPQDPGKAGTEGPE